jgi:hypothetical protein
LGVCSPVCVVFVRAATTTKIDLRGRLGVDPILGPKYVE